MPIRVFRAGANGAMSSPLGAGQSNIPNELYTVLEAHSDFSFANCCGFDTGGEWDNNTFTWTPQAGPVAWGVSAWVFQDFGGPNATLVISCFKNGIDMQAIPMGGYVGDYPQTATGLNFGFDVADGTDTYQWKVFMTTADGQANGVIDNDPRHVWINGISFGSGT